MEHNSKYKLMLEKEKSKVNAVVRYKQLRRDRHIGRRTQQRHDELDANGQGHLKYIGQWKPDIQTAVGFDNKITPIDILANREIGRWDGYVYGMKWAVVKFTFMWYILCIGLY